MTGEGGHAGLVGEHGIDRDAMAGLLDGVWLAEPVPGKPILGAAIDTRSLGAGQVFFALRGERVDGHEFVGAAASAGASVAVVDRELSDMPAGLSAGSAAGMGVLRVVDVHTAMATLASAYRRALPGLRVVGVTGSNGKTTTVRMIHAALTAGGMRGTHALKSHNNELGVPLTMLNAGPGDDFLVCEIGMSRPGEIAALARLAGLDAAVITSVGMAHIEAFGSVAGIAQEKADIVRTLGPGGFGVVHSGSGELDAALGGFDTAEIVRVGGAAGPGGEPAFRLDAVGTDRRGAWGTVLEHDGAQTEIRTALPGIHNAQNAALAFVVARRFGVAASDAAAGLLAAEAPPMRLQRSVIGASRGPVHVINDAYNANPDSVRAALGLLAGGGLDPERGAGEAPGRRIAVIGEMLEMGPHAEAAHEGIARVLAGADGIDGVVLIGSWADQMARVITHSRPGAVLLTETDAGADWTGRAASLVRGGDIVLLKGSRGVRLERLLAELGSRLEAESESAGAVDSI